MAKLSLVLILLDIYVASDTAKNEVFLGSLEIIGSE